MCSVANVGELRHVRRKQHGDRHGRPGFCRWFPVEFRSVRHISGAQPRRDLERTREHRTVESPGTGHGEKCWLGTIRVCSGLCNRVCVSGFDVFVPVFIQYFGDHMTTHKLFVVFTRRIELIACCPFADLDDAAGKRDPVERANSKSDTDSLGVGGKQHSWPVSGLLNSNFSCFSTKMHSTTREWRDIWIKGSKIEVKVHFVQRLQKTVATKLQIGIFHRLLCCFRSSASGHP